MVVYLAFGIVLVVWSTTPIAIQVSNESLHFSAALLLRWAIAFPAACLVTQLLGKPLLLDRRSLLSYFAAGGSITLGMGMTYWAAQSVPSGLIAVMFALSPLATSLAAYLILDEPALTRQKVAGLIVAVLGLALVFRGEMEVDPEMVVGLVVLLLAVGCFSANAIAVKSLGSHLSASQQTAGMLGAGTLLAFPVWFMLSGETPQPSGKSLTAVLYLALVGSILAFISYNFMLKTMRAVNSQLVALLTPVFALAIGAYFANERLSNEALVGSAIVVAGLAVFLASRSAQPVAAVVTSD